MIGKYHVFVPVEGGNLIEEWRDCLKQIIYQRETGFRLVKINVFINVPDEDTYVKVSKEIGRSILNAFGKQGPAFSITIHPPEKPWKVAVEVAYTIADPSDVVTKTWNAIPYVVCITDSGKEVWAGGLGSVIFPSDTRNAAVKAFTAMKAILDAEGMSFNHIVRQWNYIGNILEINEELQNYQVFNEVRSEFYHEYRTIHGYPSATGIGMKLGGVLIDFCAVMTNEEILVKPIDNPAQVNAYEYGQQVLKGGTEKGKSVKHPPQFERALLLSGKRNSTLFISGTASIVGQETIGVDNVEEQTLVTIENISKLTDQHRLSFLTGNPDRIEESLILLRVYVRYQKDFEKVKRICQEKFQEAPSVFIESDICRDNLLVEIEAEFLINN
jgi:enamine deaminase RidA (YjgF/YER057c/UK114 family)